MCMVTPVCYLGPALDKLLKPEPGAHRGAYHRLRLHNYTLYIHLYMKLTLLEPLAVGRSSQDVHTRGMWCRPKMPHMHLRHCRDKDM